MWGSSWGETEGAASQGAVGGKQEVGRAVGQVGAEVECRAVSPVALSNLGPRCHSMQSRDGADHRTCFMGLL